MLLFCRILVLLLVLLLVLRLLFLLVRSSPLSPSVVEEEETATSKVIFSMEAHKRHGRVMAETCQTKLSCLTAPGESSASLRLHSSMGCMGTAGLDHVLLPVGKFISLVKASMS